ncbi:MAG: hypothetical protein ACLFS4_02245, partial [Opitutales bacterium]
TPCLRKCGERRTALCYGALRPAQDLGKGVPPLSGEYEWREATATLRAVRPLRQAQDRQAHGRQAQGGTPLSGGVTGSGEANASGRDALTPINKACALL